MHINYWAGKAKQDAVVIPIKIDGVGNLVCLRSDKLLASDITKLRENALKIAKMDGNEFEQWIAMHLPSCQPAKTTMKKGRYQVVQEYTING